MKGRQNKVWSQWGKKIDKTFYHSPNVEDSVWNSSKKARKGSERLWGGTGGLEVKMSHGLMGNSGDRHVLLLLLLLLFVRVVFVWFVFFVVVVVFALVWFDFSFEIGSHCIVLSSLGLSCYIDHANFEPIEVPLPLPSWVLKLQKYTATPNHL